MFVFGKVAWLIVQPLSLALIFMMIGVVALWMGRRRLAGTFSCTAIAILIVTLFTSTGAWALQMLEARYERPLLPDRLACIVVLGGAFDVEVTAGRAGFEFNQSADRFIQAARLARIYPMAKIIVSGGDGSFSGHYKGDAELAAEFFSAIGIDTQRILQETVSRNTVENVAETRTLLDANNLSDCVLITSAFHMPRSIALFASAGATMVAWPSDYRTSGKVRLGFDFTQPTLNSTLASTAAREWLGLLMARLTGRSKSIVP